VTILDKTRVSKDFGDYVMEVPNLYRKEALEYRDIAQAGRVLLDRQRHGGLGLLF
jgi:hypothetical protein